MTLTDDLTNNNKGNTSPRLGGELVEHGAASGLGAAGRSQQPRYRYVEFDPMGHRAVLLMVLVAAAASVGDAVAVKSILDLALRADHMLSWELTGSISLVAVAITHLAGWLLREGQARRRSAGWRAAALALLAGWVGAGVALGVMRVVFAGQSHGSGILGRVSSKGTVPHPVAFAALLGCVWLLTGAFSTVTGWLAHCPAAAALARHQRAGQLAAAGLASQRAETAAAEHTLDAKVNDKARLDQALAQAEAQAAAHTEELRAHARNEIARLLGNPAATNLVIPDPTPKTKMENS